MRTWLECIRESQGLKKNAVAAHAEITAQHYDYIERGERDPSVTVAKKLGEALGFDWTRFYEEPHQHEVS